MASVATTLQSVHSRNIVHMDIHNGNVCILETPEGPQTTLIDFGCAREIADRRHVPTVPSIINSSFLFALEGLPWMRSLDSDEWKVIIDVRRLRNMCENVAKDCDLQLPEEMNVWFKNVNAINPKERMGIGELLNILEKLQGREPSHSPAVLHDEMDLTHQSSNKSPQCQ
ncbi:hypothetical protein OTU49_009938 [Cherax quadricarinatus]|uniref:Protein kinase domain-containing protein n=1 Tax=Cherax quadricarinatus TaxID=27406 RepID=A0AAW0W9C1_CHEQU